MKHESKPPYQKENEWNEEWNERGIERWQLQVIEMGEPQDIHGSHDGDSLRITRILELCI